MKTVEELRNNEKLSRGTIEIITGNRRVESSFTIKEQQIIQPIRAVGESILSVPTVAVHINGETVYLPLPHNLAYHYDPYNQTLKRACDVHIRTWRTKVAFNGKPFEFRDAMYRVINNHTLVEYKITKIYDWDVD